MFVRKIGLIRVKKWRRLTALGKLCLDSLPEIMPTGQTKDLLRIGAWNVRTMRGKDRELIEEMKKYDLGVLGISELNEVERQRR